MTKVYFQGNRAQAVGIVGRLVRMLTGQEADSTGLVKGVFLAIGSAALSDIKADFIRKSRGGTGEDGVKWPPLSAKYLAYSRRFVPGEQKALKQGAGLGKGHRHAPGGKSGLLTAWQLRRWRRLFVQFKRRFMVSMPEAAAKSRAAATAWIILKREGAQTKLNVFGSRKVEILKDTGVLLNSLSPGRIVGGDGASTEYAKPDGEGGEQQIFETLKNGVIVGTTVPYAASHQYGDPKRGLPARPFLPINRVPSLWLERWAKVANGAITIVARLLFERGTA